MTQGYKPSDRIMKRVMQGQEKRPEDIMASLGNQLWQGIQQGQSYLDDILNAQKEKEIKKIQRKQLDVTDSRFGIADTGSKIGKLAGELAVIPEQKALLNAQKEETKKQQSENQLVLQGKASRLADKPKIIENIAKTEAKDLTGINKQLTNHYDSAIQNYAVQLKSEGASDEEIAQLTAEARKATEQAKQNYLQPEIKKITGFVEQQGINPLALNQIQRNDFKEALGQAPTVQDRVMPYVQGGQGAIQNLVPPALKMGGEILSMPQNILKKVAPNLPGIQDSTALKTVGDNLQRLSDLSYNAPEAELFRQQHPVLNTPAQFAAQALPYLGGGIEVGGAKALLKTGLIKNPLVKNLLLAGSEDLALNTLASAGENASRLDTGEIGLDQFLPETGKSILYNTGTDVLGANVLKGASKLIGKGLNKGSEIIGKIPQKKAIQTPEQIPQAPQVETNTAKLELEDRLNTNKERINQILEGVTDKETGIVNRSSLSKSQTKRLNRFEESIKKTQADLEQYKTPTEQSPSSASQYFEDLKAKEPIANLPQVETPPVRQDIYRQPDKQVLSSVKEYSNILKQTKTPEQIARFEESIKSSNLSDIQKEAVLSQANLKREALSIRENVLGQKTPVKQSESMLVKNKDSLLANDQLNKTTKPVENIEGLKENQKFVQPLESPKSKDISQAYQETQKVQTQKPINAENPVSAKIESQNLKKQYVDKLNSTETEISQLPVRDGLEQLGANIKTTKTGKVAQLGNVNVKLDDIPPPYSMSGLKKELKERIASQVANNDVKKGKINESFQKDNIDSNLESNRLIKSFDEDGEVNALIQKNREVESKINNAKSIQDLDKLENDLENASDELSTKWANKYNELAKEPESTGAKRVERGATDQTKNISRTLNISPAKYQETKNPKFLGNISEIHPDIEKISNKSIDQVENEVSNIGKIATEKKTLENSKKALLDEIDKRVKSDTKQAIELRKSGKKNQLNEAGRQKLIEAEKILEEQGKLIREGDLETDFRVQTNKAGLDSRVQIGKTNSLNDLLDQYQTIKKDLALKDKEFKTEKNNFKYSVLDKLGDDVLDLKFANKDKSVAFEIYRSRSKKTFLDTEAETKFKEYQKELESNDSFSYQPKKDALLQDKEVAILKQLSDSPNNPDVINEFKQAVKRSNKTFSFVPSAVLLPKIVKSIVEGNGWADTLEMAHYFLPKSFKEKMLSQKNLELVKDAKALVFNVADTLDQAIDKINLKEIPEYKKEFTEIEAELTRTKGNMSNVKEETFKEVQDIMDKKGIDNILDSQGNLRAEFENIKGVNELEDLASLKRDLVELTKDYKDDFIDQKSIKEKQLEKLQELKTTSANAQKGKLESEIRELDKAIYNLDKRTAYLVNTERNEFFDTIKSLAYKQSLAFSPSTAILNLTDIVNLRNARETQTGRGLGRLVEQIPFLNTLDKSVAEVLNPISVKSKTGIRSKDGILNYFGAEKQGSFANDLGTISLAKKKFKDPKEMAVWAMSKLDNVDPNKFIYDVYHDATLLASTKSWMNDNKAQLKGLPDPLTNWAEFQKKAPRKVVFDLLANQSTTMGLLQGRGGIGTKFDTRVMKGGLGQTLGMFMSPLYRINNNLGRNWGDLMAGIKPETIKVKDNLFEIDWKAYKDPKKLDKLSSGFANITGQLALTTLLGGGTALVGQAGFGTVANIFMKLLDDDTRENFEKWGIPGYGDKLAVQQRRFSEKDGVMGILADVAKRTENNALLGYMSNTIGLVNKINDMNKSRIEGEMSDEDFAKKTLNEFKKIIPYGNALNKVKELLTEENKKVWDTKGIFPKEVGTVKAKGDLQIFLFGSNEKMQAMKRAEGLKEKAKNELKITVVNGKVKASNETDKEKFNKYINQISSITGQDKKEIMSKLLQAKATKYKKAHPEDIKTRKVRPRRYKEIQFDNEEE